MKSLNIFNQKWINISIDFITKLSEFNEYDAIMIVVDQLLKERYYVLYTTKNEETFFKKIAKLLIKKIFRLYELLAFVILNRDF